MRNVTPFVFALSLAFQSFAANPEHRMIVYKTHAKGSDYGQSLSNSNAADALGSIKFLVENPMGLEMADQEITAFKVRWYSLTDDFAGIYKECNKGTCLVSGLETNTNVARNRAFGTLNVLGGGHWFSFEDAGVCPPKSTTHEDRECFTYEVIGTYSESLKPIMKLGYTTAAAEKLQHLFPSISTLLRQGWIDHAHHQKSSMEKQFEKFEKKIDQREEQTPDDNDEWR